MLSRNRLEKTYLALTLGHWEQPAGILDWPIGRRPGSIVERQVDPDGRPARTRYQVLGEKEGLSLVRFQLEPAAPTRSGSMRQPPATPFWGIPSTAPRGSRPPLSPCLEGGLPGTLYGQTGGNHRSPAARFPESMV